MFQFLKESGAFILIQAVILIFVLALSGPDPHAYMAAVAAKEARAASAHAPRLVMVGGSGLSFGMISPMLRDELHREPINLGLQASLGLEYMLNQAERLYQPGDWVVLIPEYNHYVQPLGEAITIGRLLEQSPRSAWDFSCDAHFIKLVLDDGLYFLRERLWRAVMRVVRGASVTAPPYSLDSFNREGDVTAHWPLPSKPHRTVKNLGTHVDSSVIATLNAFADRAKSRGVSVWLAHPPLEARQFDLWETSLSRLQQTLDKELKISQLNRIADMRYPDDLFFDTTYHLNRAGAERRTKELISQLESATAPPAAAPASR